MAIEIDNRIEEATGHDRVEARLEISDEAARFAETHGLRDSLIALNSMILSHTDVVSSVRVELDQDPEVSNWLTICFLIQTKVGLQEVLELDHRIRDFMFESIPTNDQIYFAMQFPFD